MPAAAHKELLLSLFSPFFCTLVELSSIAIGSSIHLYLDLYTGDRKQEKEESPPRRLDSSAYESLLPDDEELRTKEEPMKPTPTSTNGRLRTKKRVAILIWIGRTKIRSQGHEFLNISQETYVF